MGLGQDGQLSPIGQLSASIWTQVGPPRGQITTGLFGQLRVRLVTNIEDERIYVVPARPIIRDAGRHPAAPGLPNRADQTDTLGDGTYDQANGDMSATSLVGATRRPRRVSRPGCITVFTSSSAAPWLQPHRQTTLCSSSTTATWTASGRPGFTQRGRTYVPGAGQGPAGHRANDPLFSIVWPAMQPNQLLDPGPAGLDWYRYDSLPT